MLSVSDISFGRRLSLLRVKIAEFFVELSLSVNLVVEGWNWCIEGWVLSVGGDIKSITVKVYGVWIVCVCMSVWGVGLVCERVWVFGWFMLVKI